MRLFSFLFWLLLSLPLFARSVPVWIVGNGLHTSLAVRARDVPFRREVTSDGRADELMFGFGSNGFYQGRINPVTVVRAVLPGRAVLHVVPVRGSLAARFAHSDVVEMQLTPAGFQHLLRELDASFAREAAGRRKFLSPGYTGASRFYAGSELFYFPKMCNIWVAQKLRGAGVPIRPASAFFTGDLVRQAARVGRLQNLRHGPADHF